ncbi:hypothetical protein J3R82DRAFT_6943 [Butyriboletus roseoflavus]|nr:hypothetical protein J3R82DRAFT_6943 [Butyriboletus roseoflavus]
MVNTMTFCDFSSMEVSHQKQTTSSSATMSTGVSNPSKPSAFSSHTRSSTLKTFSSFVETTSVQALTEFTVFMTNVCCTSHHSPRAVCIDNKNQGKRRYNIKLWKTFTDCFNCLPIAAIIDEKIFTMHGGLSPDLQSMEQIRRVMRPTDVPDTGTFALSIL